MEHRCTERYASDLKILIYKHGLPIAIGCIKNGSHSGVFVETDFADIEIEQQLSLEVLYNRANSINLQPFAIKSLAAHKVKSGFGAEVDFPSYEQAKAFVDMLRAPQSDAVDTQIFSRVANS